MPVIRPARNGFRIIEMNGGRLQTVERSPQVMEFRREVETRWPGKFEILEDLEERCFVIVCKDHDTEYILFKTKFLNSKTIEEIQKRDQDSTGYVDVMDRLEESWARQDREEDWKLSEIAGEAGERLIWAFKKDGLHDHESIYGPKPKRNPRAVRPHVERDPE